MPELLLRRDGAVATVLFSNLAKHNAMSFDMWQRMPEYVRELAANSSPASMAVMKHQVYSQLHMSLDDAMDASNAVMRESLKRPDFKEGVSSFLEKRPPNFAPYTK